MAPVADQECEIMEILWGILQKNQTVKLVNSFRGIPITCDARIVMTSQNNAAFSVTPQQAVAISLEKHTFLEAPAFPSLVKARAMTVDPLKTDVILSRFSFVGGSLSRRQDVRVQPKEPLQCTVALGERRTQAAVADVSRSGVGMFSFAAYIDPSFEYRRNSDVSIELTFPNRPDETLHLAGKITNITRERGTVLSRVGMRILPDEAAQELINAFIDHRQAQIMDELEAMFQAMGKDEPRSSAG